MIHYIKNILATFIFLFGLSTYASNSQYAVLIDAGSSGSRAHVFEYLTSLPKPPIPIINDIYNKNTSPGLSSFANNPSAAGASLKPILDEAARYLSSKHVDLSQVKVSVLATAGMRLLPENQQEAIYSNVRNYIRHNYAFILNNENVRTISGTQEGLYGWLDVNYLSNNFTHPDSTVGSIDMGGASTQIAFATSDTSQPENEIDLTINNTRYHVFSKSFLGLGQNQALSAMTSNPNSSYCYPDGYSYNAQSGAFNFSGCSDIYRGLIQDHHVEHELIPTVGQKFIAYTGIFYNYDFFNVLQSPTDLELQSHINAVCTQTWTDLQSTYPEIPGKFLSSFCANGVYFYDLLYNTYHLEGSQLSVTSEINKTGIDWTLGALLYDLISE